MSLVKPSAALDYRTQLVSTARALEAADIPYVPVWGLLADQYNNPARDSHLRGAKVPSVKWGDYQTRRASAQEKQSWFDAGLVGGWAIITGELSRLVMVDLDADSDETAPAKFAERFPDLLATYTERTPTGGLHLLYRLPPDTSAPATIKAALGEFRGRNVYTVIAPTRWREMVWSVEYGDLTTIKTLTLDQLQAIMQFYADHPIKPKTSPAPPGSASMSGNMPTSSANDRAAALAFVETTLGIDSYNADGFSKLIPCPFHDDEHPSAALYVPNGDPTKAALFCHAGCTQRGFRNGWSGILETARMKGFTTMRLAERPTRLHISTIEALLQHYPGRRGESIAKVVIALFTTFDAGGTFDRKDAAAACEGVIKREGLHNALETLRGLGILSGFEQDRRATNSHTPKDTCSKPESNRRGQPAIRYTMPSGAQLAAALKVEPHGALNIPLDLLKTRTVAEILLERFADKPIEEGTEMSYARLGQLYGKGGSTIRRYADQNPKIVRQLTIKKEIEIRSADQLQALIDDPRGACGGRKIVSAKTGCAFPAYPAIAARLIETGDTPTFIETGANKWGRDRTMTDHTADQHRALLRLKEQARRANNRAYPLTNGQRSKLNQAHFEAINAAFEAGDADYLRRFVEQHQPAPKVKHVCFSCGEKLRKGQTCPTCSTSAQPLPLAKAAGAEYEQQTQTAA